MKRFFKSIIGMLFALFLWQIISLSNILNPIFFASPSEVFFEFIKMFQNGSIFNDAYYSIYRLLLAIGIASAIGIPLGIFLGYLSGLYDFVADIIDFLRSIPPIVFYPLLLIILGAGDSSRIGVAIFGALVIIILIISKGLSNQSPLRKKFFKSMGASNFQIIKYITWHEALPHIVIGLRTAFSFSLIVIIVTEMLVGAHYGLGTRVQNVQITSNIPDLFATIIIIGIIGVVLNKLLILVERKLVFWKSS